MTTIKDFLKVYIEYDYINIYTCYPRLLVQLQASRTFNLALLPVTNWQVIQHTYVCILSKLHTNR